MPKSTSRPLRENLNLRIAATDRQRIDRAAASKGKTRTDFVLETVRRAPNGDPPNATMQRHLTPFGPAT